MDIDSLLDKLGLPPVFQRFGVRILVVIVILVAATGVFFEGLESYELRFQERLCGEYCERNYDCPVQHFPNQPMNTYSNIAYLVFGLWALRLRRPPTLPQYTFAALSGLLFVGSGYFHGAVTVRGHFLDVIGMVILFSFMAMYAIWCTHHLGRYWISAILGLLVAVPLSIWAWDGGSGTILGILAVAILIQMVYAWWCNRRFGWRIIAIMLTFAGAFTFRQWDINRSLCDPDWWFQGHAMWHILSALGLYLIFVFFNKYRYADTGELPEYTGLNPRGVSKPGK